MKPHDWLLVALFLGTLTALTPLLGGWMARVFTGQRHFLQRLLGPVERLVYRIAGIKPDVEMSWKHYAAALLVFDAIGLLFVFGLQLAQHALPLNPANINNVPWPVALNTAVSFATNTNWQAYSGESSLSYLTQMLGLGVLNFLSAATGIAGVLALIRGLTRRNASTLGNAWADLTRTVLYVLIPLAFVLAVVLVSQGTPQTLSPYTTVTTLEGAQQVIPLGPAASQIAIKQLGTNGGGFFGVNSAHPFENPTPLSNFLQLLAILALPAALTFTFGRLAGNARQGWALFATMLVLYGASLGVSLWSEYTPNPVFAGTTPLEGKEVRLGVTNSILWSTATTAASNGSVNAMQSSLSPGSGGVALVNMLFGEVVFGGIGSGLYGILLFAIITVFLAGLMVGRTPEYLGKKIEAREIRLSMIAILAPACVVLAFTALGVATEAGRAGNSHTGAHGLTEIFYGFASMGNNNGSAFGGLGAGLPFYTLLGSVAMLVGRYAVLVPVLAIAGGLVAKKISPPSPGTFPTTGPLFVGLLATIIVIETALTFFPALSLGPLLEQGLMLASRAF
jgi:potassium-transporting ATPase potassium-binding subunit